MGRGRPPICKFCGERLDVDIAYMAVITNSRGTEKKEFYCTREHHEAYLSENKKLLAEKEEKKQKLKEEKCLEKQKLKEKKKRQHKKEKKQEQNEKTLTDKDIAYKLICEIIGRPKIINTILWKEWKVWNEVASDDIIMQYFMENREYLLGAITRIEDIEFKRIRYLSAILKNSLGDFKPKQENAFSPQIKAEHYDTKYKHKVRVALEDIEEECYE